MSNLPLIQRMIKKYGHKNFHWIVTINGQKYASGVMKSNHGAENASWDATRQCLDYLDGRAHVL